MSDDNSQYSAIQALEGREDEKSWLTEFKQRRNKAASDCADLKNRAIENHRFAAPGEDQVPYDMGAKSGSLPGKRNKFALMSVNEIHPILSTLSGRQVMGRFERRYIPRRKEVREWSEVLSNWDRAVVDNCHADQEESSAFKNGPGIGGISWLRVSVDYLTDEEGEIVIEEVPVWRMLWPAREARKKNLTDREWQIEGDWYRVDKFRALWPDKVAKVKERIGKAPNWETVNSEQGQSSRIPWEGMAGSSEGPASFFDVKRKQIWVERYEWREPSARFFVIMAPEGIAYSQAEELVAQSQIPPKDQWEVSEMAPEDFRAFKRAYEDAYGEEVPRTVYLRKEKYVYRYAYLAGDVVLEEDEIPIQRFTYEPITGYPFVQPDAVDWRSVVDALRTPQIWINIFLTMLVKYMQINPKGVLFVERGVFRSRQEGMQQFASTGGLVEVERGKLSNSPSPPFHFHTGGRSPMDGFVQGMLSFAQDLLPRSVGFNHAALGQLGPDLRRISGQVVEHVRDAAVASHAELYDSLALCRQRIGLILLSLLGGVLKIDHLRRVVGDEPFEEEQTDPNTGEVVMVPREIPEGLLSEAVWSVAVEETKPAPDRTRFFWESITESGALQTLLESGALAPEDIAELAPDIPEERRKKMIERIEQQRRMQEQMMAQQQQQQQGQPPPEQAPVQ